MSSKKNKLVHSEVESLKKQSVTFYRQGKYRLALEVTEKALGLSMDDVSLINNASSLSLMIGAFDKAEKYYRKNLEINPESADLPFSLASLLKDQGRFEEAEKVLLNVLKIKPDLIEARLWLANIYCELNRIGHAEQTFYELSTNWPDHVEVHYNFGLFLKNQHRYEESRDMIQKALKLDPDHTDANHLMAFFYYQDKCFDEAEKAFRDTLHFKPDLIGARWNLSHLLLDLERFDEGWDLYESRYHLNESMRQSLSTIPPPIPADFYNGQSLHGKSLLIWPEQGIGDEIMFASILPELENSNADIIVACDWRLVSLLNRSFPFLRVMAKDPANQYPRLANYVDYHVGIGSLPKFFRDTLDAVESKKPYLKADDKLVDKWRKRFDSLKYKINIGISWFGGNDLIGQQDRSISLLDYLPILEQPANFINLQYGDHQVEINRLAKQTGITIHDWEDADPLKDLENFAAQIKALDLVVSIDNSTVHFSGALGTRSFVMLPFNQDWRWAESREDSYWYPGVLKLFRQKRYRAWDDVIERVAEETRGIVQGDIY